MPDEIFFDHLAHRRFPAGHFIRQPHQLNYLEEPDVFHDVFGHVHADAPGDGRFCAGLRRGRHARPATRRIAAAGAGLWYTVEFGLVRQADGLRIYGSGIASSASEARFALEDDYHQNRIGFDLERVMRTLYRIDDFQESYFVLNTLNELLALAGIDFAPAYGRVGALPSLLRERSWRRTGSCTVAAAATTGTAAE